MQDAGETRPAKDATSGISGIWGGRLAGVKAMNCGAIWDIFQKTCWWALPAALLLAAPSGAAAEVVFLEDGRTIQAEKVEDLGDRIRIEGSGGAIEVPKDKVMTIHPTSPPSGTPGRPSPADVYRDVTGEMVDKVRREMQSKYNREP
jgi:hypothetical protein